MRVFFILILYLFSIFFSNCFSKNFEIDKIVAVVNNQVILNSDINQILFYLKQEKNIITVPLKINFLTDKILEKLIIDTLILEEAKKFNIIVSNDQVDNMLRNIAFKNHITFDEFKKNIIKNNTNDFFNYEDYIKNIKKSLKIKILQDYILKNSIHITKKEIYFLLHNKIKEQNDLKKVSLKCIVLPFLKKENSKLIKNKKILVNNLFKVINDNSNFDDFYENFKKNKNVFLTENISLKPLKGLKKLFSNKLYISKRNEVLGPILGKKGWYIVKVENIKNNSLNKTNKTTTEFHIQHCLVHPSTILSDEQAKKDIFAIYNDIKTKHYSFEYAVSNFSHDINSSHKKGDLGWISNKSFDRSFKNTLKNLNENEISKPIKSKFGWHIIKLLKKRRINEHWKLEKEKIYETLLQRKIKLEKINWINKLKNSSYINIF
ncbi:peptidylprolyl isomerase [Buchnera aphidicola]|uniref:Peptidylprolyl isomerase n=1 Tax=Buchnera aphidicola (Aphis nerii) TaxID=1241835 RepID=A0A4D6XNH5_9GAMM|nr:peptidylprolyl isomerase [Buchnera aphidicola]QCI18702.1 peptidylprolyl isomerase [Buchnera aphidicola (Aphis nerii)]